MVVAVEMITHRIASPTFTTIENIEIVEVCRYYR
jgi:hypothetical protein